MGRESPEESLSELLRIDKVFGDNHVLKAQISYLYAKQKKYDDSIKYIDTALKLSENNALYLYNKAVVLDRKGDYEEAKKTYHQVLNLRSLDQIGISTEKVRERLNNMGT